MHSKKIIFFGTSEFAIPVFEELLKNDMAPLLVITTPDKPRGRGKQTSPSPVKALAQSKNLRVLEPDNLKSEEILSEINNTTPDVFVIASYGKIIPASFLRVPKKGTLNVHPSILPKYRGPSPIQSAIIDGQKKTGVTIMLTDAEIDHGPILRTAETEINPKITYKELEMSLAKLGANLLIDTLKDWLEEKLEPQEQEHSKATFSKKITKEDGRLNWKDEAELIERKIRALNPWPGTYAFWERRGAKIRLLMTEADVLKVHSEPKIPPGTVFKTGENLGVVTGKNALIVKKIKPEGKKEITSKEFLKGYSDILGALLG